MTFDKNHRVDVNTATASYTVDETGKIMEQETIKTETVELIVVRRDTNGDMTPTVIGCEDSVRYHFPMEGVVRIIKRITTVEEQVLFNDTPSTIANLPLIEGSRRRWKEQAQRRAKTEAELRMIEQERLERLAAEADCVSQRRPRKPRKKETEPRETCHASCCGAPNRHQSHLDGFCFDCRPSNSASREEVKY